MVETGSTRKKEEKELTELLEMPDQAFVALMLSRYEEALGQGQICPAKEASTST